MKENRGRYSYLHPEREKYISGRSLGTNFDKDYLLNLFEANALAAEQEEKQRQTMPDYHADPIAILFIRSDLRLVVDLQNCIKAQQSRAYAQKVKISNLQQMAKTVAYIQENGFDTRENLQTTYDSITLQMHDARQKTKDTETQIKSVNEQIHYLGQYLSTKSTYNEFLKARFKGKFRKDHADEIEKHEKAAQILKAQNPDGSLPKMKDLKLEKERLLALKAAQYDTYTYYADNPESFFWHTHYPMQFSDAGILLSGERIPFSSLRFLWSVLPSVFSRISAMAAFHHFLPGNISQILHRYPIPRNVLHGIFS